MWAASPALAESAPYPTTPTTAPTEPVVTPTQPAETEPAVPPADGGIDAGGEVTLPNPGAPAAHRARVLVFGDSISATFRYSARGTAQRPKAWWAYVAEAGGLPADEVMLSAEGGSGLLMRGKGRSGRFCSGTTFGDRLGDVARTRPDVVLVEVGRNDIKSCSGTTRTVASVAERRAAAVAYFNALAKQTDRIGVSRSSVYVMTAWGSSYGSGQVATTTIYEAEATARGFSWIPVPALVRQHTSDTTHPNAQGTRAIASAVMRGSDVTTAIRSHGLRHATVPARASVVCSGVRPCRAKRVSVPLVPSTFRIWGTVPGTPQHHVAETLTRGSRVAPVLGVSTARQWRTAARTQRAATAVAHARVGDVAWWSNAPAGIGSTSGHVAVVQKVAPNNSWVVVSELTARGVFRSVRYSGASLPRAYLRFARTNGSPRGLVASARGTRNALIVRGRAVDTDAVRRGVGIRVTVKQGGRTWTRSAPRAAKPRFAERFSLQGLRRGPATVHVWALDTPGTRGSDRKLLMRRIVVR